MFLSFGTSKESHPPCRPYSPSEAIEVTEKSDALVTSKNAKLVKFGIMVDAANRSKMLRAAHSAHVRGSRRGCTAIPPSRAKTTNHLQYLFCSVVRRFIKSLRTSWWENMRWIPTSQLS